MQNLIYDISKKVFRASDGSTIPGYAPAVSFGEKPVWAIQLVDTSQESPLDLSGIYSWRAAMDTDFSSDTEPMARTVSGITATMGDFGPVVSIPIETATLRFLQICNGRQKTSAYFELAGMDGNGDTVFYVCFPVSCLFPIDPVAAGVLEGVDVTTLTQSQVEAIASAAAQAMLAKEVQDAVATAVSELDPFPADGTAGQVLTKTEDGVAWADAQSGSGSGDGTVSSYTLPAATADTLGGVKVGSGLSITEDGTLSATASGSSGEVDLSSYATKEELSTGLSGKADTSHTHAQGDISGLPATLSSLTDHAADSSLHLPSSGGTSGQVLTKTDAGAQWADAPSSSGTGEAGIDAGAVRYVKSYDDYLEVCDLAREQEIHHSALFMAASDISGDLLEVRKSMDGEVVDDTLRKGHAYLRVDFSGAPSSSLQERTVSTSTYVVEKVRFVPRVDGEITHDFSLISGREDVHYLFPDSFEKASGGRYGFTFQDRERAPDASLNEGWPTVAVDISQRISAYKEELEREGTYIGSTPWCLADANVDYLANGTIFKKVGGVWKIGSASHDPSSGYSEQLGETEYDMVILYKDSTGSYVETPTPNATETTTESNGRYGTGMVAATIDITPDPLRLAIQALEGIALEVSPGKAYSATLTANATLTATGGEDGYRQEAFLDVIPGAYSLTPGDGITFAKDLTAGKVNHCRIVWTGTSARLLVDDVTDAAASGGSGGSGEETGGSGSGGESGGETGGDTPSDGWPTKIIVSNVSSSFEADVSAYAGDYTRTGETLTVLGENIPIWSNGAKYIYGVSSSMGSDLEEPAIALYDQKGSNDAYVSYAYRMKSDASTAWTMGDSANACGMSATITEEGGGSESGGSSDAFPTTFTVTACSGNEAAKGEYTRTGETTTVGGTDYPVYSYTQPVLATAFYIYVCQYRQGSSGAFWSLKDGSYSASDEGYSGLGSVAVNTSTGLPMAENWSASGKQATVTWA